MIKLLAVDMDGTCLNRHHRISPENMQALQAAAAAGILVVPTTGRTATCLPEQLMQKPFYRYVISSNGADVADLRTQKSLYRAQIPWEKAAGLLRACADCGLGLSAHVNHQFLVQGVGLNLLGHLSYGRDARNVVYEKDIPGLLEREHADVEELQLFFFSDRTRQAARDLLRHQPGLVTSFSSVYAEVYDREASKGNALAALAEHLGLIREEVACIGDAENDLSMFGASGLRFAMGNAIDRVKQAADVVVASNDDSGVAQAIQHHILR